MAHVVAQPQAAQWAEPFSALYWRIRVQLYLLACALVAVTVLGVLLYRLGMEATSLVYVVAPDGEAMAVLDRRANRLPSQAESLHVARRFVSRLWGFNSSTVLRDVSEALNDCSPELAARLRQDLAAAQFVRTIRQRGVRSEVAFANAEVVQHTEQWSRVRLAGTVAIYPIADHEGLPREERSFDVVLVLGVVPRNPNDRVNGLEVVRIGQPQQALDDAAGPQEGGSGS